MPITVRRTFQPYTEDSFEIEAGKGKAFRQDPRACCYDTCRTAAGNFVGKKD
jgi:hypothetical protein